MAATQLAISGSLWRNRLARSAVNRKVGGSSPPRDVCFVSRVIQPPNLKHTERIFPHSDRFFFSEMQADVCEFDIGEKKKN